MEYSNEDEYRFLTQFKFRIIKERVIVQVGYKGVTAYTHEMLTWLGNTLDEAYRINNDSSTSFTIDFTRILEYYIENNDLECNIGNASSVILMFKAYNYSYVNYDALIDMDYFYD